MDSYAYNRARKEQEYKEYLNRMKRTLNTHIEDNVFPHWRCHTSLLGWSSMNYPSILINKKNLINPHNKPKESSSQSKFSNLHYPITSPPIPRKRPISSEAEIREAKLATDPNYAETLASKIGKQHALQTIKEHRDMIEENKRLKSATKFSAGTLTTYTYEEKKDVIEQFNKQGEGFEPLRPVSSYLGAKIDPLKARKVKQLDDIEFEDDESNEDEDTYQYKVMIRLL